MLKEATFEMELLGEMLPSVVEVLIEYQPATRSTSNHPADAGEPAVLRDIVGVYDPSYEDDQQVFYHGNYVPVLRSDMRWHKAKDGTTVFAEFPSGATRQPAHGEFLVREVDVLTHPCTECYVYQLVPFAKAVEKAAEEHLAKLTLYGEAYAE